MSTLGKLVEIDFSKSGIDASKLNQSVMAYFGRLQAIMQQGRSSHLDMLASTVALEVISKHYSQLRGLLECDEYALGKMVEIYLSDLRPTGGQS